jgi:hypothetical protein
LRSILHLWLLLTTNPSILGASKRAPRTCASEWAADPADGPAGAAERVGRFESMAAVYNASEFAAVETAPWITSGSRMLHGGKWVRNFTRDAESVCVTFEPMRHPPGDASLYEYIHSFYYYLVLARQHAAEAQQGEHATSAWPPLRVYVPAGAAEGSCAFEELVALFGGAYGLAIERAPWVPFCLVRGGRCERRGLVSRALRGRIRLVVLLLSPAAPPLPAFRWRLREAVHVANGLVPSGSGRHDGGGSGRHDSGAVYVANGLVPSGSERHDGPAGVAPRTDTIVLALSDRSSKPVRTLWNESAVASAIKAWASRAHPHLRVVHYRAADELDWRARIELFARARLLVAVYGPALSNCYLMRAGAVVVEVHGALWNDYQDDYGYYRLCALYCGLRHVALPVEDAHPQWALSHPRVLPHVPAGALDAHRARAGRCSPRACAYVEPPALVSLLDTALPPEADAGRRVVPWRTLLSLFDTWASEKGGAHFTTLKERAKNPHAMAHRARGRSKGDLLPQYRAMAPAMAGAMSPGGDW